MLIAACLHGELAAEERQRIGRAYDMSTGVLLYESRHVETLAGGKVVADRVRYLDAEGRTFGNKQVDFRGHPYAPQFSLSNERTGHLEALLRVEAEGIEVRFRERAEQELRQTRLSAPANAVADAGFDRLIEAHWDELQAGEHLVRQFLIPSRLEFMDFRIRRDDNDADADSVRFALEIDSALLRLIAPSIAVIYDRERRRIIRYEGPSNLRDDNGDNHHVRVEFEYPTSLARATDDQPTPQVGLAPMANSKTPTRASDAAAVRPAQRIVARTAH